jgi:hypothetical protein
LSGHGSLLTLVRSTQAGASAGMEES